MASAQDIRDALASLAEAQQNQTIQTNDAIRALLTTIGMTAGGGGGGGAFPLPIVNVQSTVRKSTETTVQLSLADAQLINSQ